MLWRTSGVGFVYHPLRNYQPLLFTFLLTIWKPHIMAHPSSNRYQYMCLHDNGKLNQYGNDSTINPKRKGSLLVSQFSKMINSVIQKDGRVDNPALYQVQLRLYPELGNALSDARIIIRIAEELMDTGNAHTIYLLLHIAYLEGTIFEQNVYEKIVTRLARGRHWRALLRIVAVGRKQTGGSTRQLLNLRARALVATKSYALLGKVFEDFATLHITPDQETFQAVIEGHLRNNDLHQANIALNAMESAGFIVNPSLRMTIAKASSGLGPNLDVQRRAYEASKEARTPLAQSTLNTLVKQCLDEKDLDGALYLLNSKRCSENDHGIQSTQAETNQSGSSLSWPNTQTFSLFINHFARDRDMSRIAELLQRMRAIGVTPDSNTAAALIRAYYDNDLEASALEVLSELSKGSRIEQYFSKWSKASSSEIGPFEGGFTIDVLNAWIQGSMKIGGGEALDEIFHVMKAIDLSPDVTTINALLSTMSKCEDLEPNEAVRMIRLMSKFAGEPMRSSSEMQIMRQVFRTVLRRITNRVKKRGWNLSALHLRTEGPRPIKSKNIVDSSDFSAGLIGLRNAYKAIPFDIRQSFALRGVKSDREMLAMRIRHDAVLKQDMDSAQSVFKDMLARGIRPTAHHYAALMEGYTIQGDMTAASDTLKKAEEDGIKPNVIMHTILITGHAKKGKPEQAMRAFHDMIHRGINPDFASVDATVSAYFIVGEFRLARQVILNLWPLVAPFPEELRDASLKQLVHALRALKRDSTKVHVASREDQRKFLDKIWSVILQWRPKFRDKSSLPRPVP